MGWVVGLSDFHFEVVAHPGEGAGEGFIEVFLDEGAIPGRVFDLLVVGREIGGHDIGALEGGEIIELAIQRFFELVG